MINLPIGIFVIVCAAVVVLLYISFVQYQRAEKALKMVDIAISNMHQIHEYIRSASESLNNPQLKQAFEADDEVGTFFREIQNIQTTLEQILPENVEEEEQ